MPSFERRREAHVNRDSNNSLFFFFGHTEGAIDFFDDMHDDTCIDTPDLASDLFPIKQATRWSYTYVTDDVNAKDRSRELGLQHSLLTGPLHIIIISSWWRLQ